MDTPVAIELVDARPDDELLALTDRAFGWFAEVERRCTRFDESSELRQLTSIVGRPVSVSPLLFNALAMAIQVAAASDGAFDPTVGAAMERAGFDTNYQTGQRLHSAAFAAPATFRDVELDHANQAVTITRPLALDLGAVAKGLAIDLAGQELQSLRGFLINAGGDVLANGQNLDGRPWEIGIRHPRHPESILASLRVDGAAVCTSGDYERRSASGHGHHILNPGDGTSAAGICSVTVIAPTAMSADALSTAAFVLGVEPGRAFLQREGVDAVIVAADLSIVTTPGIERYLSQ